MIRLSALLLFINIASVAFAGEKQPAYSVSSTITKAPAASLGSAIQSTPSLSVVPLRPVETGSAFMPSFAYPLLKTPTTGTVSTPSPYLAAKMFDDFNNYRNKK